MERQALIEGYAAPIYRAVWEPIQCAGVPRIWFHVWAVFNAALGLLFLTCAGMYWVLAPVLLWALGQGAMMLLTLWDPAWPDLLLAQLTRGYRDRYEV